MVTQLINSTSHKAFLQFSLSCVTSTQLIVLVYHCVINRGIKPICLGGVPVLVIAINIAEDSFVLVEGLSLRFKWRLLTSEGLLSHQSLNDCIMVFLHEGTDTS